MKYTDFFSFLNEGMTATVSGADYESKDLENLLGISFILTRKVVTPIFNSMGKEDSEYFQDHRPPEIITPDGPDTFKPIGTLNFYTSGWKNEYINKIVAGIKYYLPEIGLTVGNVRGPEQSGMYKSGVIRFDITKNSNVGKAEDVPEIQLSTLNANLIYGRLLRLPDFEEGYSINAVDLLKRIEEVLKKAKDDEEYLYRVARRPEIRGGGNEAMHIMGGAESDYLLERLEQLKKLCEYAIEHGHQKISIG